MKRKNLKAAEKKPLLEGARATAFGGERAMVNYVELEPGTDVPEHAHPEEQLTLVLSGRIRFVLEGEETELGPGDAVWVPSGARHAVQALDASVVLDVFSPVRVDLLEKLGR